MRTTPVPFPSRLRSAAVAVQALAIASALAPPRARRGPACRRLDRRPHGAAAHDPVPDQLLQPARRGPHGSRTATSRPTPPARGACDGPSASSTRGAWTSSASRRWRGPSTRGSCTCAAPASGSIPSEAVGNTARPNSIRARPGRLAPGVRHDHHRPVLPGQTHPAAACPSAAERAAPTDAPGSSTPTTPQTRADRPSTCATRPSGSRSPAVNRLRAETPFLPVFFTGDMNDREEFFCPVTARTELRAANGGATSAGSASSPGPRRSTGSWVPAR